MRSSVVLCVYLPTVFAARPFLNEPDTGFEGSLGEIQTGTLPPLDSIVGLPDFDWAARNYLNTSSYTYFRNGAGGEWSYRNNLEVFHRVTARPRVLVDVSNVQNTLETTILGRNFSAPFFISPAARGDLTNPNGELGLVQGAADGDIIYIPSSLSSVSLEDIATARVDNETYTQTIWQQLYIDTNMTATLQEFRRIEQAGSSAIVLTVDSAAAGVRHRAERYDQASQTTEFDPFDWPYYRRLQNMTTLPIILKGIMTVDDALLAVENGARAIILSNHGARNLDTSPSPLEIAYEIHKTHPEVFSQIDVLADGGVRYGIDALKLLALGVKAVGLGRPFMYANVYGTEGVRKAIDILKFEIANDAAHLGLRRLSDIGPQYFRWGPNFWYS